MSLVYYQGLELLHLSYRTRVGISIGTQCLPSICVSIVNNGLICDHGAIVRITASNKQRVVIVDRRVGASSVLQNILNVGVVDQVPSFSKVDHGFIVGEIGQWETVESRIYGTAPQKTTITVNRIHQKTTF